MKKNIFLIIILVIVGGIFILTTNNNKENSPNQEIDKIISRNGIHWHPELRIFVQNEEIQIPENVGLGNVHNPIHTHDDLPVIHLEFNGLVKESDVKLGNFFRVWDKNFYGFGDSVDMKVNNISNYEFENYVMRDGDKIKLHY